jgi:predicted HAD superfamily Cof-like phosphohydrolase
MSIDAIKLWHSRARPDPDDEQFQAQLACDFEEMGEMIEELDSDDDLLAYLFMKIKYDMDKVTLLLSNKKATAYIKDRENFLREMADRIVTGVGVCHTVGMNISEAVDRVNAANWSKYDHEGKPIFDDTGKIIKGPNYKKATFEGCY